MEKNKNKKYAKKIFAYWIIGCFLLVGLIAGGSNALAAGSFGDSCTSNANCTDVNLYCQMFNGTTYGVCIQTGSGATCQNNSTCSAGLICVKAPLGTQGYCVPPTPSENVDMTDIPAPKTPGVNASASFTPQISIPGYFTKGDTVTVGHPIVDPKTGARSMVSDLLPIYIGSVYKYLLTIVGIVAAVILMAGGILWLTSAGNESRVTKAKEMIFGSLAGVALLYGSYLILSTINPALIKLNPIVTPIIARIELICCQYPDNAEMVTDSACKDAGGARKFGYIKEGNACVAAGCCVIKTPIDDLNKMETICTNISSGLCKDRLGRTQNATFQTGNCSAVTECQNNILDCSTAKEGDYCKSGSRSYGECYGGTCYTHYGQMGPGMPCGTKPGSRCYKSQEGTEKDEKCGLVDKTGQELYRDMWNLGASCQPEYYCCNTTK
ncbi:MAG: pilin [Candidatus Falkowbacteria bacterium]|nr:pilin [Candidatus Falkowbacteria bacterium]